MSYESELPFLRDVLEKCHVRTVLAAPDDPATVLFDPGLSVFSSGVVGADESVLSYLGALEPCTMHRLTDRFSLSYLYFLLPRESGQNLFLVGPYLPAPLSSRELLELGEKMGVSPKSQRYFEEYYSGIPILPGGDRLFVLLDSFCERLWGTPSFAIADVKKEDTPVVSLAENNPAEDRIDDTLMSMKVMERRYAFENELIRAVSLGQIQKETLLLSMFSEHSFEKRVSDPIRNAKNYGIIMNTLLRKAAEQGGVHPMYLDRLSSEFAMKIEQITSLRENSALMTEMFRAYCRLVRKHAIRKYSPVVQKTVLLIDADLSADVSLRSLAEQQNISVGYLATVFKKETGKTVSAYVREKRIRYAAHLLATTHLQIQTVALHCGVMDVQYFSKMFKREMGKTPKEYRESILAT